MHYYTTFAILDSTCINCRCTILVQIVPSVSVGSQKSCSKGSRFDKGWKLASCETVQDSWPRHKTHRHCVCQYLAALIERWSPKNTGKGDRRKCPCHRCAGHGEFEGRIHTDPDGFHRFPPAQFWICRQTSHLSDVVSAIETMRGLWKGVLNARIGGFECTEA